MRILQAKEFFRHWRCNGLFIAVDFFHMEPDRPNNRYDIILIHDVIEHIEEKDRFFKHTRQFLAPNGIIFWGFPAWQMPFGGHQQICRNKIYSHIPFIHLLPTPIYHLTLRLSGEKKERIDELMEIKACRTTIESFEKLIQTNEHQTVDKVLWFINPHYQQKFNLRPRRLPLLLGRIRYVRNFFCTSCFYLTQIKQ